MPGNDLPIKGLPAAGTVDVNNDMLAIEQSQTGKINPATLLALVLQVTLTGLSGGTDTPLNGSNNFLQAFQNIQAQLNARLHYIRLIRTAMQAAIAGNRVQYPGVMYEIEDAVGGAFNIVVFATSQNTITTLAINYNTNQIGNYNITADTFTALTNPNTILHGTGAPGSGTGNNGDFYIDNSGWVIYGPKTGGAWGTGTLLLQPPFYFTTTRAALNTLIGASSVIYPAEYEITDAVSGAKRIVVKTKGGAALCKAAISLTDDTFGIYNITADTYTPLI